MASSAKVLQQKEEWEGMKKRGHFRYVAQAVLMFVGSYAIVRVLHILAFKLGWLHSRGATSFEELVLCAVVSGAILGELHWVDMKRKFRIRNADEDPTMI
jgi:hypothetical protein